MKLRKKTCRKFGNNLSCRHSSKRARTEKSTAGGVGEVSGVTGSVDLGKMVQSQVRVTGVVIPISKILEQACVILKIRLCHQQGQRETHVLLIFVIM